MEKNQRYQKINQVFMVLYLLVCLWGIVDSFLHSTPYYMGLSLLSPLFMMYRGLPSFLALTGIGSGKQIQLTIKSTEKPVFCSKRTQAKIPALRKRILR